MAVPSGEWDGMTYSRGDEILTSHGEEISVSRFGSRLRKEEEGKRKRKREEMEMEEVLSALAMDLGSCAAVTVR